MRIRPWVNRLGCDVGLTEVMLCLSGGESVLRAVRAEFKGFKIEPPESPGWLFDELWEVTPLFGGENQ